MKRGTRGLGRLYKRDSQGREHPAASKVKGCYWLECRDSEGKRVRFRLDVGGLPVEDLKTAREEQMRIRAPYLTRRRCDAIIASESALAREMKRLEEEEAAAAPQVTLDDAWEVFLHSRSRREFYKTTERVMRRIWMDFYRWAFVHHAHARRPRDITEDMAREYCAEKFERFSASTYNRMVGGLKEIFGILCRERVADANPFAETRHKRMSSHSKRPLTLEELHRVIGLADGEMRTLFIIGLCTGMRLGDCATLKWCEVDMDAGVIRRVPRKTSTTSGASVVVGIPAMLENALRCIPTGERGEFVLPTISADYLAGRIPMLSKRIQSHFRACGIETNQECEDKGRKRRCVTDVGFHSLRHTWVTMHAEAGTPASLIQEAAGHSSPAMTQHYTHVSSETARRIAGTLDDKLGKI